MSESKSVWHGDSTDGIEFRYDEDNDLDEVCLYIGGKCVLHVERMDDNCYWAGLYTAKHTAHLNFGSSGDVNIVGEEGWKNSL